MARQMKEETIQRVTCESCGMRGRKENMIAKGDKYYCCEDCAEGKSSTKRMKK